MNENREGREIDAMQVIGMLLKSWWVIVIAIVLCVGVAIGYTQFFTVPEYTSSSTLLLNGGGEGTTVSSMAQQILAGQYQSKDYPYILNANDTMTEAAEELNKLVAEGVVAPMRNKEYTARSISGMVRSESVDDSRIFRIIVTGTNPQETRLVTETVTKVFIKRVELLAKVNVGVVDNPVVPTNPTSSGMSRNAILGFAIGLIIGAAIAIAVGLSNDAIESESWLINRYKDKYPLLSSVPDANAGIKGSYYRYRYRYKYSHGYGSHESKNGKKT